MRLCVIGAGYVGLVTGSVLADIGNSVLIIENNIDKLNMLKKGQMPFYEKGMDVLLKKVIKKGTIEFTNNINDVNEGFDIIMIAVGTPAAADGRADMTAFYKVAEEISNLTYKECIITIKSTVPVGTSDWLERYLNNKGKRWLIASNPEFLRQGTALKDTLEANRIIIGTNSKRAAQSLRLLYAPLNRPTLIVDRCSAEMIKYASNTFLATKISFANEMANICEQVGADIKMVVKGMSMDPRIGGDFLGAGIGYGGSCFTKDLASLINTAKDYNVSVPMLKATEAINKKQRMLLPQRLHKIFGDIRGLNIAILGITFKPGTDDLRDAPALDIIKYLLEKGAKIRAYDPQERARKMANEIFPEVYFTWDTYDAMKDADASLLVTEWPEIKDINWHKVRNIVKRTILLDGRNFLEPDDVKKAGFTYIGVGRGYHNYSKLFDIDDSKIIL